MTLTEADVARLERAGHVDFARPNDAGDLELVNRGGVCIFLDDGRCGVYRQRPEGCRFYPFILDLGSGRVVRDEFCPHADEFPSSDELFRELTRSVEQEGAEARRRRRQHG